MSRNVSALDVTQNPWSSSDKTTLALRNVLFLAEKTGHTRKRRGYEKGPSEEDQQELPSLKLIALQREITKKKRELQKVNLELQCRVQDKETADITHIDILKNKVEKIQKLNAHIESIMEKKDQLTGRLQQPFVGDYIKMDAAFHKYASELFPQIAPILGDLNYNLDNINWTKRTNFSEGKMDTLIAQMSNALADMRLQYNALVQMRGSINDIRRHRISHLEASVAD
ncbi:HAUS augmin-like complex subunit 2 isoform X1 [Haliotis rufescens]|uniref:HAUS augmin-like complex subunit 2 isoform X1 n=1 Tax=Haliotis rufescens TaxID=6454 RepID=UPI00201EEC43|nr:HAUS augmin-like complex subunit 2 isoform X1 [Haliotis rufescens]